MIKKPKLETFRMGDLFIKLKSPYFGEGKKQDNVSRCRTKEYSLPLINCKDGSNGIMYYGRHSDFTAHKNVLSIIYNGPPTEGQTYYQEIAGVHTDAYLIALKNEMIISLEIGLYLATAINKSIHNIEHKRYSRGNKATWDRKVENDIIFLPVQTNAEGSPIIDPERKYHTEGYIPDWNYMQERIAELEQERIAELEQYIVAAGLNDYELNELDKEVLSAPKEKRDFTTGKLFSVEAGDVDIQQKDINGKGCYFINSGLGNNGIKGMTDRPAKVFPKNTITVDFWGNAFYRDFEYKLATHNHVFSLSGEVLKNQEVGLYLASSMTYFRKLFSYNNMGTRNKIMKLLISLPIQTNEEGTPIIDPERKYHAEGYIPDWDYMTSYIRAMKKVVIADVVKYKDEVIAKPHSLISTE